MARPKWEPTTQDLKTAQQLAARGLTLEQIARSLGIVPATLYKKKKLHKEFVEALQRGRATGIAQVANALFQNAMGFVHEGTGQYIPPDTRAQVAFLSRRDPENWSERRRVEMAGAGGGPIQVRHSAERAVAVLKNLLPEYAEDVETLTGAPQIMERGLLGSADGEGDDRNDEGGGDDGD